MVLKVLPNSDDPTICGQLYPWKRTRKTEPCRLTNIPPPAAFRLFAIRNPNVLDLNRVFEKPAALGDFFVEPVDRAAFIGKDLLEIPNRERLRCGGASLIAKAPNGIHVIVFGEHFEELRLIASHNVHGATRHIAGVKKLVKICGDERIDRK